MGIILPHPQNAEEFIVLNILGFDERGSSSKPRNAIETIPIVQSVFTEARRQRVHKVF